LFLGRTELDSNYKYHDRVGRYGYNGHENGGWGHTCAS
jgi:hypothetical protein